MCVQKAVADYLQDILKSTIQISAGILFEMLKNQYNNSMAVNTNQFSHQLVFITNTSLLSIDGYKV